ncbi:MAG: DUF4340 domain-containing protein [Candidatus Margulisiibacteriota bacterium]
MLKKQLLGLLILGALIAGLWVWKGDGDSKWVVPKVTVIRIEDARLQGPVVLVRHQGEWRLTGRGFSERGVTLNQTAVSQWINQLGYAKPLSVFKAPSSTGFGLEHPVRIITFEGKKKGFRVLVGAKTLDGGARYIGFGNRVGTVDPFLEEDLLKNPLVLREDRLVTASAESVQRIEIVTQGRTVALERWGGGWLICRSGRVTGVAEPQTVTDFLTVVQAQRLQTFEGPVVSPAVTVRLLGSAASITITYAVSGKTVFAGTQHAGWGIVPDGVLRFLSLPQEAWQAANPMAILDRFALTEVTIGVPGQTQKSQHYHKQTNGKWVDDTGRDVTILMHNWSSRLAEGVPLQFQTITAKSRGKTLRFENRGGVVGVY